MSLVLINQPQRLALRTMGYEGLERKKRELGLFRRWREDFAQGPDVADHVQRTCGAPYLRPSARNATWASGCRAHFPQPVTSPEIIIHDKLPFVTMQQLHWPEEETTCLARLPRRELQSCQSLIHLFSEYRVNAHNVTAYNTLQYHNISNLEALAAPASCSDLGSTCHGESVPSPKARLRSAETTP